MYFTTCTGNRILAQMAGGHFNQHTNKTADGEIENLTSINLSEQMNQQTSHIYPNQEIHR